MVQAKNTAAQPTLLPSDPLGQRFLKHFHHGWGFIYAPTPNTGERPNWRTETRHPLEPRNLWQQYLNPNILIGLRFDKETNYLLLDVDQLSSLHPTSDELKYRQVLDCMEEIGLCRPVPIQSSERGGLHIYYFLEDDQHSYSLARTVQYALEAAGFKIRGGELEIFPNCKAYSKGKPSNFNAHRLPLQAGSYLLDDSLEPWSNNIEDLLNTADWSAAGQDYETLAAAIAQAKSKKVIKFPYGQGSKAKQWQHELTERITEGWTGPGQTNELLKNMGCLGVVFRHLSGKELVDYIVTTSRNSPGYEKWCGHQHEIEQRAREWAQSCERYYTPYASYPQRVNSYKEQFGTVDENKVIELHPNQQRQQETLERIRSIVAHLQQTLTFPERTSDRVESIIAASKAQYGKGISQTTLYKQLYLPLWHPDHQNLKEEQPVNLCSKSNIAIFNPGQYPQIPDPWLEEIVAETDSTQVKQEQALENYTPPPYMKVLYMTSALALPPATPNADLDQMQKSFSTTNSSKFLNVITDKQNQCLSSQSGLLNENKQSLFNNEILAKSITSSVIQPVDIKIDSKHIITLKNECFSVTEPSVPNSKLEDTNQIAIKQDVPLQDEILNSEDYRQIIRLRLQANTQARYWVKMYCMTEKLSLLPLERIKLEQMIQRLLMLKCSSLILQQEAQEWLEANQSLLEMAYQIGVDLN
ncbi:hypothetical protein, partial [Trichormus variabilis]